MWHIAMPVEEPSTASVAVIRYASVGGCLLHGWYVTYQLAEVAVPRELFMKILSLIDDLRPSSALA